MEILYILFGWLLGLLSPLIVDLVKKHYKKNEIRAGIIAELDEIRARLIGAAFLLTPRYGTYDRDFINWMLPIIRDYSGTYFSQEVIERFEAISRYDDNQFQAWALTQRREAETRGMNLKTYSSPYIDSTIHSLSSFNAEFQKRLMEIKSQIKILNEEVETSTYYFRMTFDGSLTDENQRIIRENLSSNYTNICGTYRRLADKIGDFISYAENSK
ncbi:MAG: hypothetical protein ACFFBD_03445 [Candidatus Hodarchaeota archaeon]